MWERGNAEETDILLPREEGHSPWPQEGRYGVEKVGRGVRVIEGEDGMSGRKRSRL